MQNFFKSLYKKAQAYYAAEPAKVNSAVGALAIGVGVPLVVGGVPIGVVVAVALGFLLTGSATRAQVYPQVTVDKIKRAKAAVKKR